MCARTPEPRESRSATRCCTTKSFARTGAAQSSKRTTGRLRMTKLSRLCAALAAAAGLAMAVSAQAAATIQIINGDPANVGFNDPTPVAPVGGNPGTTLGQQRLNAFQYAASIWGTTLDNNAAIRVLA